jgi:hypothetical protein
MAIHTSSGLVHELAHSFRRDKLISNVPNHQMMMLVICSDTGINESIFGWIDLGESGRFEARGQEPCCIRMSWWQSFVNAFPDVHCE